MNIHTFEVGPFFENTYLIQEEDNSILIDPGFYTNSEFDVFFELMSDLDMQLDAILLTHAHVDHILGLQRVLKRFDVPVYLNTLDLFLWKNFGSQATMFGFHQVDFSFEPEALPVKGIFQVSTFNIDCLYTPGHSPDHTSFYFKDEGIVIAGDALFKDSIGRTDLYQGNFDVLEKSIKEKLYTLPKETIVYPGHGPKTTIGHELNHNPFVSI